MSRGIIITPIVGDISPVDLQQLRSLLGYSIGAVLNQIKTGSAINTNAIISTVIAEAAVTAEKIKAGAVTAAKILDGTVHKQGYFVLEGCRVAANGGSNTSTVTVGVGYICAAGSFVTVANGSVASAGITAAGSYHDLIVATADGTKKIIRGTTAAPSCPATCVVLASVAQVTANAAITAADIGNSARLAMARY